MSLVCPFRLEATPSDTTHHVHAVGIKRAVSNPLGDATTWPPAGALASMPTL